MTLLEIITDLLARSNKKWEFSLEYGRGETYRSSEPTLYGLSTYERSSVLAGRQQRIFLFRWDSWEAARAEVAALPKRIGGRKVVIDDCGASTHIPVSVITSHLPDDSDY